MRLSRNTQYWLLAILAGILACTGPAAAQRGGERHHVAGQFDYFHLVLSWSPTHCQDNSRGRRDTQCGHRRARPYAFVLHGLWPQYERGYPEHCRTRRKPFVPNPVIDSMMDVMPSRGLIIHEYKKHGTCSGFRPSDYFRVARALYKRIRIPNRFQFPKDSQFLDPEDVVDDFIESNPALKPDMIRVVCRRGNANRLQEIRICLTRKGEFRACSEPQRHLCRRKKMYIPPVR
jgi:ribonuclease T2